MGRSLITEYDPARRVFVTPRFPGHEHGHAPFQRLDASALVRDHVGELLEQAILVGNPFL